MSDTMIERRRELVQRLERGFQEAQGSDRFREYLTMCAKFHRYSLQNTMLILLQRSTATHVAGYQAWVKGFKRYVKKGEKGIQILAPGRVRKQRDDDEEDGEPEPVTYFFPVHVFDVSQTEGEPLPTITDDLQGDDGQLFAKLDVLAQSDGLTIDRTEGQGNGANGFYRHETKEIWVRPDTSPVMAARTLCHELAHHLTYSPDLGRQERETIAESVAFIVLGHFGIDAGDYSFGYLASWTDPKVFREKVKTIHDAAAQVIDSIEKQAS